MLDARFIWVLFQSLLEKRRSCLELISDVTKMEDLFSVSSRMLLIRDRLVMLYNISYSALTQYINIESYMALQVTARLTLGAQYLFWRTLCHPSCATIIIALLQALNYDVNETALQLSTKSQDHLKQSRADPIPLQQISLVRRCVITDQQSMLCY